MKKSIILGGGCFWCTEAVFKGVPGVISVMPGYAGGNTDAPTYKEVCSGRTGHAEVIRLEYDPRRFPLNRVLDLFFRAHDPTQRDRQGDDIGSQYRSIIMADAKDIPAIREFAKAREKEVGKIMTEIRPIGAFYPAEEHHRDYYARHSLQPYCMLVIRPKLKKLDALRSA